MRRHSWLAWLKWLALCSAVAAACTSQEIRDHICRALCMRDGFDTGFFVREKSLCLCGMLKQYDAIPTLPLVVRPPYPSVMEEK